MVCDRGHEGIVGDVKVGHRRSLDCGFHIFIAMFCEVIEVWVSTGECGGKKGVEGRRASERSQENEDGRMIA
jgi:hypothetical protein